MTRALTEEEAASIREKAANVLESLQQETAQTSSNSKDDTPTTTIKSWLTQEPLSPSTTTESCRFLHQHGFLLVENFVGTLVLLESSVEHWAPASKYSSPHFSSLYSHYIDIKH